MEYVTAILSIVLIDLVLSGDNAIVIGMAAHRLPPPQQRMAIIFGGLAAVALRITLTAVAAYLLTLPALRAIGGALLLWIAFKLLHEEDEPGQVNAAASLREAITTILVADAIMSLDNVLGVAAASRGDVVLLLFGLLLSMAVLMVGGSLFATLVNRLWWLAYLGCAVIAYTGMEMLLNDPLVEQWQVVPRPLEVPVALFAALATLALAHFVHRHRPLRAASVGAMVQDRPAPGSQVRHRHDPRP